MSKAFSPVGSQSNFPEIENKILEFWEQNRVFEKSVEQRSEAKDFVFYDGPPFATGLPHYGHLLAGTIKDVVPRYQSMRGKRVERVFGWDCHGLPVEYEMEKELNLSGKKQIEDYGVSAFNEKCRGIVLRYSSEWEKIVHRMGRWVDFRRGYRTMDPGFMESIWWVFASLWKKDLIYEGHKILPYCPRCSTPLSNFEANQGYEEVEDPAITVRFADTEEKDTYYLAWTTTPWTLPSNLALAVGPDIEYVKVKDGDCKYVLARARLDSYYKDKSSIEILESFKGSELAGKTYVPLFNYFADFSSQGAFRIVTAGFVSTEDGTGLVHMAPGFGEDDYAVAMASGIPELCPVDEECRFKPEVSDYAGRYVKDCDKDIMRRLKTEGKLVHRGTIRHNYPHCWRDDAPLIYRAVSTWFVNIAPIKQSMIESNSRVHWVPSHLKDGRFGKWLENAKDWAISRNRFWGTPIPVWRNDSGECLCISSIAELEKLSGRKVSDIHKHFVDEIEIPSQKGGSPLKRVPEVLDCWFESGSMPYAQKHYPFENKKSFEENFPADFIAEGLDQTRGWFYTLVVLGSALFEQAPFRNVVVNGLVLAEDGQKMSKRKKNYPDPMDMIRAYGADSIRLFMLGSPVVRAEDLRFSENAIKETLRSVMIPLWNVYSFFVTYANVDGWTPEPGEPAPPENPQNPLDRWILSSLSEMTGEIRDSMDDYRLQQAANRFEKFIDDLTNWYVRRSRRRFWKSQNDLDKTDAYRTLYYVMLNFCKTAAPFIPFVTEEIYRNLRSDSMPISVHLCDYPEAGFTRDERLERQMECAMKAVSLGRFLRSQNNLRVRQPLAKVIIAAENPEIREMLADSSDIIADELNVKKVLISEDDSELVTKKIKANYKALGSRLGKNMKEAAEKISSMSTQELSSLLKNGAHSIRLSSGEEIAIGADDIIVQRDEKPGLTVANEGEISVALDTVLDASLRKEGLSREFVSKIQNLRKDSGLDVTDRIEVTFSSDDRELVEALAKFSSYICSETLALRLEEKKMDARFSEAEIFDKKCAISILKSNCSEAGKEK